jgi:uncharacterized protein YnzC (UPF0291/DUF896 family)
MERIELRLKSVFGQLCSVINVKDICNIIVSYLHESHIVDVETFDEYLHIGRSETKTSLEIHQLIEEKVGNKLNIKSLKTDKFLVEFSKNDDEFVLLDSILVYSDKENRIGWKTIFHNRSIFCEVKKQFRPNEFNKSCSIDYISTDCKFTIFEITTFDMDPKSGKSIATFDHADYFYTSHLTSFNEDGESKKETFEIYRHMQKPVDNIDDCKVIDSNGNDLLPRVLKDFPPIPDTRAVIDEMISVLASATF